MEYQSGAVQPIGSVSEGWELIKNDYWLFFGMTLVLAIIVIGVSLVLNLVVGFIVGLIGGAAGVIGQGAGGDVGGVSAQVVVQLISNVVAIFTGIITGTLGGMLTCGIYTALSRKASGGFASFSDLFEGFQYFSQALTISAILTLITFALNIVVLIISAATGFTAVGAGMMTRDGRINPAIFGAFLGVAIVIALIYILVSFLVAACTFFVYPLIVERKLSAFQAIGLSIKAALNNLLGILGLFFIQFFIALGGALLCFVGVFFVLPILSASIYAAYLSVFGRGNTYRPHAPPTPPVFNNQPGY